MSLGIGFSMDGSEKEKRGTALECRDIGFIAYKEKHGASNLTYSSTLTAYVAHVGQEANRHFEKQNHFPEQSSISGGCGYTLDE